MIAMLQDMITPHDQFQDAVLLLNLLVLSVNCWFLYAHLCDHRRWREYGLEDARVCGPQAV